MINENEPSEKDQGKGDHGPTKTELTINREEAGYFAIVNAIGLPSARILGEWFANRLNDLLYKERPQKLGQEIDQILDRLRNGDETVPNAVKQKLVELFDTLETAPTDGEQVDADAVHIVGVVPGITQSALNGLVESGLSKEDAERLEGLGFIGRLPRVQRIFYVALIFIVAIFWPFTCINSGPGSINGETMPVSFNYILAAIPYFYYFVFLYPAGFRFADLRRMLQINMKIAEVYDSGKNLLKLIGQKPKAFVYVY